MEYLGRPSLLTGKVEMIEIVRIVNSVFESNTYLAISRNCDLCFLIDCGDPAPIIENINNRGLHLKGIFITHSHFDHIYGLDSIIDEYPETPIYISALGKEGLYSDKLNLSRYSLCPYVFQHYSVMKELKEGDTVYLYGSAGVEVYETPGHDRSCLTYKFGNCLFTGDAFIPGLKVPASFPNKYPQNYPDNVFFLYRRGVVYIPVMVRIMRTFSRKYIYRLFYWLFIPYYVRRKSSSSVE